MKLWCECLPAYSFITKRRLQHKCFPVKFAKLLRTPFLTEHLWWLLLIIQNLKFKLSKCCHKNEMLDETRIKPIQHANCIEWTWKCCMKCKTNDSVAAWEYTFLWGTTYLHIWIHIYILNFCTPLSCNSSLKSHKSSHHRCFTKKVFLKILQYSQQNISVFNKVAGLHNFL